MGLDFIIDTFFTDGIYFHHIFNLLLISSISTILSFTAAYFIWTSLAKFCKGHWFGHYNKLSGAEQMILCTHSVYVLLLTCQLPVYSLFLIKALFGPDFLTALGQWYAPLFCFVIQHGLLYVIEAATRSIIKFNSLLLWHHILWIIFIVIATYSKTVFAIKLDLILDWLVVFEAPLYLALIAIRLQAPWHVIQRAILFAAVVYGLSRIFQTILLAFFFAGSYQRVHRSGHDDVYWSGAVLSLALTLLQLYTGYIYYRLYLRCQPSRVRLERKAKQSEVQESVSSRSGSMLAFDVQQSAYGHFDFGHSDFGRPSSVTSYGSSTDLH